MKEPYDTDGHFKLRMEPEIEEPALPPEVNELRLEKISQRVTLISILIPVLIVIVLVIAYLDIQKRMTHTEDTGLMEFQKLSTDLESRFSSLSVRQARLEETLTRLGEEHAHTMAGLTTKLGQLEEALTKVEKSSASRISPKELAAAKDGLQQQINAVSGTVDKVDNEISAMTQELKTQISKMGEALTGRNSQFEQLQERLSGQDRKMSGLDRTLAEFDRTKIDKPALDLALRLEYLKIDQAVKARIETLQATVKELERKVNRLSSQKVAVPAQPRSPSVSPRPVAPQPSSDTSDQAPTEIEEQTIGQ